MRWVGGKQCTGLYRSEQGGGKERGGGGEQREGMVEGGVGQGYESSGEG
jgi:hypothetical protein